MRATGIVRKIDPLGRIVIPRELLKTYGINLKDPVEIFTDGDYILLKKYEAGSELQKVESLMEQVINSQTLSEHQMEGIVEHLDLIRAIIEEQQND
jgi:AbrB family transcriptional regulator, transcriptional pleiotropic regulator of transition state genes